MASRSATASTSEALDVRHMPLAKLKSALRGLHLLYGLLEQQEKENATEAWNETNAQYQTVLSGYQVALAVFLERPQPQITDHQRLMARNLVKALSSPGQSIKSEVDAFCQALAKEGAQTSTEEGGCCEGLYKIIG